MQEEFSRIISLTDIGRAQTDKNYTASAAELSALAKRFNILSIDFFNLSVTVTFINEGEYKVLGKFTAGIKDKSTISLEPVCYEVSDSFETVFSRHVKEDDESFDIEAPDTELLIGNEIDVGKIAAEYLALSLDPFPHNEGETFIYKNSESENDSPFSSLQQLKKD